MEIRFEPYGLGWAEAVFARDQARIAISVSWVSQGLVDLLRAVISVAEGAPAASCGWAEEPGSHRIALDRAGDLVTITVVHREDLFADDDNDARHDGEVVFQAECTVRELVHATARGVKSISPQAFAAQGWGEFPREELTHLDGLASAL